MADPKNFTTVVPFENDAGKFRVSTVGGTAGDSVLVDGVDQTVSATIRRVSAAVSAGDNGLIVRATNLGDASDLRVSSFQGDAGLFHVSAVGVVSISGTTDVEQAAANLLRTSALPTPMATYFQNTFHVGTTDTAVVSGVAGQVIKIYAINLTQNAAGATKWTRGGTDLQGVTIVGASAGYVMVVNPPAFLLATTSAGTDLELALSGTISAGGWVNGWTE